MIVDIPDDQVPALERLSRRLGLPIETVVSQAVAAFIRNQRDAVFAAAFGIRPDGEDGLAYQERLRAEWDR